MAGDGVAGSGVGVGVPITVQTGTSVTSKGVGPHRLVVPWVASHSPTKASTTKVTTPAGSPVIASFRLSAVKGPFASARQQDVVEGKALETDCSTTRTVPTMVGIGVCDVNPEQGSAFWDCAASVCQRTRSANPPPVPLPALPEPPQPIAHAVRATSTQRAFSLSEMDRSPRRSSARHTPTSPFVKRSYSSDWLARRTSQLQLGKTLYMPVHTAARPLRSFQHSCLRAQNKDSSVRSA